MTDSNKVATQATDELFNHFARISEKANGVDMEVWFANRDAVRARIESDRLALAEKETEIQRLKSLCTKADGYLGLWLHRYWRSATPDDMKDEVDKLIGQLRKAYEGE